MCGIIGFNYEDKDFLRKALNITNHRGPDSSGTYSDKEVSLGHNRLSIIDLSKSGSQPMSNEDNTIWIVFNGEIYNFKHLRKDLEKKHSFKSNTDTEVLIHLYEEYGIEMVNKIWGMFAFCIYDSKRGKLFLARDRVGIKPIYYYFNNKKFIFCSEIKGILENEEIPRDLNLSPISSFLTFRANTQEDTFFKKIKKIMPGHYLIYDLKTNKASTKKYWDIPNYSENKSQSCLLKELKNLLDDSVNIRLMSDVPFGAYLSGGIDSGTVVSLMSKHHPNPIKTFSVGFEEEEHSEVEEARFLAEKLNTDHHELLIKENSVKKLPDIIYQLDEPMSDPTSIPIYFLSQYAKKYCTVILTGEGADEIFAGYPQYKFMKIHNNFLKLFPSQLKKTMPKIISKSPKFLLDKGFRFASSLGEKGIDRFSNFVNSKDYSEQYFNQISIFNEEEQSELLKIKINLYEKYREIYFKDAKKDIIPCCQRLDFKEPMVEDLLMKLDKNTMAFAIEGRVPFLDHRIVEFGFKLPSKLKLNNLSDKYLLRKAARDLIPKQTNKRKKRHFFVPIDSWFEGELSSLKEELLSKNYIKKQNIFDYNYIDKVNKGFSKSKLFYSRQLWTLITFQIWHKQYIMQEKVKI